MYVDIDELDEFADRIDDVEDRLDTLEYMVRQLQDTQEDAAEYEREMAERN